MYFSDAIFSARHFVYLEAREKGKPLVGTIKQLNSKTKEEEISQTFQYVDEKFVFENEEEAKKMAEKEFFSEDVMVVCETDKAVELPEEIACLGIWKEKIYGISKVTVYVR